MNIKDLLESYRPTEPKDNPNFAVEIIDYTTDEEIDIFDNALINNKQQAIEKYGDRTVRLFDIVNYDSASDTFRIEI